MMQLLPAVCKVLVVTFASAPGTPNWGGLLNRILAEASPEEKAFDILYVCDGGRSWYSGLHQPCQLLSPKP